MSEPTYYLTEFDGSVCRGNPDGLDVALDEFEVVEELNRLREALETIRDYEVEWKGLSDAESAELDDCAECARNRERNWPPSGLCDEHYSIVSRRRDENQHATNTQYIGMKRTARTALKRATK